MLPVFLAPGPTLRGLVSLDDSGLDGRGRDGNPVQRLLLLRDLASLFEEDERTDAHAVAYCILQDGELVEQQPRLTKEILPVLLARGFRVECHTVWIDFDLKDYLKRPGKVKWTELTEVEDAAIWTAVEDAHERLAAKGMAWTAYYTTQSGLRFVHALALPVPAGDGYKGLLARFHAAYQLAGLPVDGACRDWTRLYRAPRVNRDGLATSNQPWFFSQIDLDDDTCYYVPKDEELVAVDSGPVVQVVRTERQRPDPEEARGLVEFLSENNRWQMTVAGKAAKTVLKDARAFDWIYNHLPLAREGRRHDMLTKAVGEVVGTLHGHEWATPELVYGLLYEPAGRIGEDEDWTGKVWEMTCTFWDRETGRKATKAAQVEERVRKTETVRETERERFLRGVREWLPQVHGMEDEAAIEYVRLNRYGIVMDARRDLFHILLPSGYYDDHVCSSAALPKVIEQRGMQWLVPVEEARDDGRGNVTYIPVSPLRLVQRHARVYTAEQIRLDRRASYLQTDWQGRDIYVDVPFALRDDVQPERVETIYQSWLAAAGGDRDRCDEMLRALGSLLLFQYGPTAAVLLWGEGNAGKSLTATGLAECITTRCVADGASLVDNFNDSLRRSPIIHVEEAPDRGNKGIDSAAALRRIITAPYISIEQKGKDKMLMQGVHRVLMTSNSKDMIRRLLGNQARTASDWRAVGERLAEFHIDNAAQRWFMEHNQGWHETRKWIGTHGRTGLYAKFWFWVLRDLIEWKDGKPIMRGRRLLYEGNCGSYTIRQMEANSGGVPDVVCAINRLISETGKPKVALHEGKIYLTTQAVLQEAVENGKIRMDEARMALESLLDHEQPETRLSIRGHQARWRIMDAAKILTIIEMHAVPSKAFEVLKK
jgi:hypothetical protein